MDRGNITLDDVMAAYSANHKIVSRRTIRKAYEYAERKHAGMKRGSGGPYICHPLRVARYVAEWGFESDVVAAALLHDVAEDCDTTVGEIRSVFGRDVARTVDAVTALSDRDFADHTLTKAQKDLLSDAKLQREMNGKALYVKIADRLDNLSTLDGVPEEKRIPKAEHTREIIIPMALLEHAYALAEQLEELCFMAEHPETYRMIRDRAARILEENARTRLQTVETLRELLCGGRAEREEDGCGKYFRELLCEPRSCVSIFRRISREAENIRTDRETILAGDRIAFSDLTLVLSDALTEDGKETDPRQLFFTAFEKRLSGKGLYLLGFGNGERGEETCFILADGMDNLFRLFVRTEKQQKRYLLGDITDAEEDFSIPDVNEIEPRDTYNEKIRVFDRDGCAHMIDRGATVLDFAFAIHTDLGLHFDYAMMDESRTRLHASTRLNEGDMITIVASEQISPNITWFRHVRTRKAVQKLINYFQDRIAQNTGK